MPGYLYNLYSFFYRSILAEAENCCLWVKCDLKNKSCECSSGKVLQEHPNEDSMENQVSPQIRECEAITGNIDTTSKVGIQKTIEQTCRDEKIQMQNNVRNGPSLLGATTGSTGGLNPNTNYISPWRNSDENGHWMLELAGNGLDMTGEDVTIAFWVYLEEANDYILKYRTQIQGHIGIGGLIVVNKEFKIGSFDENTGEFKAFGLNLMKLERGWHHCTVKIMNYGKKNCQLSFYLNGNNLLKRMYIQLKSQLKYFGNSADRTEKFFEFKDLRIYKDDLSEANIKKQSNIASIQLNEFSYQSSRLNTFMSLIKNDLKFVEMMNMAETGHENNSIEILEFLCFLSSFKMMRWNLMEMVPTRYFPKLISSQSYRRKKNIYVLLRNLT